MVDFKKLRAAKIQPVATDPIEIFRRLPKPAGINDLYTSQAHVLEEWHNRRADRDVVIKLHTGGGKTLVGLLVAQSVMNDTNEPVIYLSPNNQLVQQTLEKAAEYSIPAVAYEKNADFPDEFLTGRSVLVCNYNALFNGKTRFGLKGSGKDVIHAAAIILDDAHVAFSTVRDSFTLSISKDSDPESYAHLVNTFRNDFKELGKLGTFDDVVNGGDPYAVLEVPYWGWQARSDQIRQYLRDEADSFPFEWPFLRDAFDYCHCLISRSAFVLTPFLPLVDLVPTFAECPHRIYMSATIGDDSAIVRTFDADPDSVSEPIMSKSLAGVSERMILAPELMQVSIDDVPQMLHKLAKWMTDKQDSGTVILTPSGLAAKQWQDVATVADTTSKASACIRQLQEGESTGPFAFANRYDGIDLPGEACRLLILAGLPRGMTEYDLYRANTFLGGAELNSVLAQRIEQGMGRGARGAGDYCIVILTGKDLISWIGRSANLKFLTSSSRAQLQMGTEISKSIADLSDLVDAIKRCLARDKDWVEYHAETLAELAVMDQADSVQLAQAAVERKAFKLTRDAYFEKAISTIDKYCKSTKGIDSKSKGWLTQMAARAAQYWGRQDLSQELQQQAYADNSNLLRPRVARPYVPLTVPGEQAEAIVAGIADFRARRGYIAEFDEVVAHLVPEASANQFEQALETLGNMLGFHAERPENLYGVGPDVLWLLNKELGLVIEAKSRKNKSNALTKLQHGQLLNAAEWFKLEYPDHICIRVSIHPNITATKSTVPGQSKALSLDNLQKLVADARNLVVTLCESAVSDCELVVRCEQLLVRSTLNPNALTKEYLLPFEQAE